MGKRGHEMREWIDSLPDWQVLFFALLVGVAGISLLQLSFSLAHLHDKEPEAVEAEPSTPEPAAVEAEPEGVAE